MSVHTMAVPAARLHDDLIAGDRITEVDGHTLPVPRVVESPRIGTFYGGPDAVRLVNVLDSGIHWNLYPGNVESVTVERDVAVIDQEARDLIAEHLPEPFSMTLRERNALRRNPHYVTMLRSLAEGPRRATSRGEGVTFAALGVDHTWGYGWTERGPRRTWQITQRGLDVLRADDRRNNR